ncbi:DUF2163 domain-containing protein [Neotabrizicola sp. sgz301269]|uniref:DUF2163 domain-containing protein n=1 Tax=Neotabrizicola sp. sgz301269 TaxID=3276282 RepID=UPI00376F9758
MSAGDLDIHLSSGATTVCRAWMVTRADGLVLGFTDHDCDLTVAGVLCKAGSGLTARALQQVTGLAVDNSEALGALSGAAITEADLAAGRYDRAEVRVWLVNWADPGARAEIFRGALGEVTRRGAEFRCELRGLSEPLNQPIGFAYTRGCSAVLGDSRCRFDLAQPGYSAERAVEAIASDGLILSFAHFTGFDDRWFEGGRLIVLTGLAMGLSVMVKSDRLSGTARRIELWQTLRARLAPGDLLRLFAGCDKRAESCRVKFNNFMNFRGFPHLPGEDWLTAYPRAGRPATGGSLLIAPAYGAAP